MKEIKNISLLHFEPICVKHVAILRKIKDYNFNKNLDLIKTFLETTDFTGGVNIYDKDFKRYIVEDNFLIGIEIYDDFNLDDYKYLFDAYNVYFSQNGVKYTQDLNLTMKWRKMMKTAYPDSSYVEDIKELLNRERKQRIELINDNIDKQIKSL